MNLTIATEPVPLRLDEGGAYRVGQSRVRLDTVIFAHNSGSSAAEIVSEFPSLTLAEVHLVLGYYLSHQEAVDAYLLARQAEADQLRAEIESEPGNRELRERLTALWNQRAR